jgi:hypothetical protein
VASQPIPDQEQQQHYYWPYLLLEAAADAGEWGLFAALYRQCLPLLCGRWPSLREAREHFRVGLVSGGMVTDMAAASEVVLAS